MKQIIISGNLGANAVRRTTSEGKEIMTFNVAVDFGKDNTIWFGVVSNFREKLHPYLVKGQSVVVSGDLSPRVYNGNLDLTVSAERIELCGKAPTEEAKK